MIGAVLMGGLGNQLFQYAAARRLADVHDTGLELDLSWFSAPGIDTPRPLMLDQLAVRASFRFRTPPSRKIVRRLRWRRYVETEYGFDASVLSLPDRTVLSGYFQSPRYFADVAERLRGDIRPVGRASGAAKMLSGQIASAPRAVAVHVRRGDYVTDERASAVLGSLDTAYYLEALSHLPNRPRSVFVFSDDLAWCAENLDLGENYVLAAGTASPVEDLMLMAACQDTILANSTLSWWAGWLNSAQDKTVIAPAVWSADRSLDVSDLIPAGWLRV
jgi:hypothetical protein